MKITDPNATGNRGYLNGTHLRWNYNPPRDSDALYNGKDIKHLEQNGILALLSLLAWFFHVNAENYPAAATARDEVIQQYDVTNSVWKTRLATDPGWGAQEVGSVAPFVRGLFSHSLSQYLMQTLYMGKVKTALGLSGGSEHTALHQKWVDLVFTEQYSGTNGAGGWHTVDGPSGVEYVTGWGAVARDGQCITERHLQRIPDGIVSSLPDDVLRRGAPTDKRGHSTLRSHAALPAVGPSLGGQHDELQQSKLYLL